MDLIEDDIAKQLLKEILVIDKSKRLNISQIKKHKFFEHINFNDIESIDLSFDQLKCHETSEICN